MRQVFDTIKYLVGDRAVLERMENVPALPPFSHDVLDFLGCLSKKLLNSPVAKRYPDVAAYGFWIRRAYMEEKATHYDSPHKIGRGVVFHIAPSNIPVQFAVSMTYAMAAGNASIVKVSNKAFEQVDIICNAIRLVLAEQCPGMSPYVCIIRYDHDDAVTRALSDMSDARMIWGGDNTITTIRRIPMRASCLDIGFADRYSIAVIDSDAYLEQDSDALARNFYTDTYYSDQNACSSTRLVVWTGKRIVEAKEIFWKTLAKAVSERYEMNDISASEKLLHTAVCASHYPGIREIKENNLLVRVELPKLYDGIMTHKGNSGYFFEYSADDIEEIVPILRKECQTVTYVGNLEGRLRELIRKYGVRGIDRIVRMGHSMDLSFVWDGYDLPEVLSRHVRNV